VSQQQGLIYFILFYSNLFLFVPKSPDSSTTSEIINPENQTNHHHHAVVVVGSETAIPPELLELEQVDMTTRETSMDPFEWTVRKLISIPKRYYWEVEDVDPEQLPIRLKLWHRSVAAMGTIVRFTDDRIGKPVAAFLGLTSSRFDYVTSTMTEADWEYSRRTAEQRRILRLREQEEGEGGLVEESESGDGTLQ
jgi:hypothetical protein